MVGGEGGEVVILFLFSVYRGGLGFGKTGETSFFWVGWKSGHDEEDDTLLRGVREWWINRSMAKGNI